MMTTLPSISPVGVATIIILITLLWRMSKIGSRDPTYPPGPPTVPLLGNVHLIPRHDFTDIFPQWIKRYGRIFSLKIGPGTMIVLCDRKAVHKLLVEEGSATSDRPPNYVSNFITRGNHLILENLDTMGKLKRKIITQNFSQREIDTKHAKTQAAEATVLMMNYLTNPEGFQNELRRYATSVINSITWGYRAKDTNSFAYRKTSDLLDNWFPATEFGANPPIEMFPFLAWVPASMAFWKRRAMSLRKQMDETWGSFRRRVEDRRARGERRNCIIDTLLDEYEANGWPEGLSDHSLDNLMGEIIEGGSDTTASLLMTIIQLLAHHPEVQQKARVEIDRVCGTDRSPDWHDFPKLPYINCIIKEASRWRPGGVSLPHVTRKDLNYDGMRIPKGALLLLVMAPMHHDEDVYPNATSFNPDRYSDYPGLAHEYAASSDYSRRDHYIYGAGRRICPGIHLAERSLWRITSKLIWGFNFKKAVDPKTGDVIDIDLFAYTHGAATSPKPFKVGIEVRSDLHEETIKREYGLAQEHMAQFED